MQIGNKKAKTRHTVKNETRSDQNLPNVPIKYDFLNEYIMAAVCFAYQFIFNLKNTFSTKMFWFKQKIPTPFFGDILQNIENLNSIYSGIGPDQKKFNV